MVSCDQRIDLGVERRRANALNVEIGTPASRCKMKLPEHWKQIGGPTAMSSSRWLASGGSPLVLGACSSSCPMKETAT
jgi:hypothetical protein